jgi:hypothetical protein
MKKQFSIRSKFFASAVAIAMSSMLVLSSCDKDDDDDMDPNDKVFSISGTASGDQEVPTVSTTATGTLSGSYDPATKSLIYSISWTGLSGDATMTHFHGPAVAGEIAPPIETLTITTNGTAGTAKDTIVASAALHTALMAGQVYYNVHTAAHPDGEIRGQVNVAQ